MNTADLHQGIYDALSNDAAVSAAVSGVYTDVPQPADAGADSVFPYISLGPIIATPWDTKTENGISALVQVDIWSRSRSALTWRAVESAVYDALHRTDLLMVGVENVVYCQFENSVSLPDADGKTTHIAMEFRVVYTAG